MSLTGHLSLVWTATVIAEALSMVLSIALNHRVHKKLLTKHSIAPASCRRDFCNLFPVFMSFLMKSFKLPA